MVRTRGELDLLTTPRCRRVLWESVLAMTRQIDYDAREGQPWGPGRVVCDLEGVEFFGAAAIGMLVEIADHARSHGVDVVVVASGRPVCRALSLTGVDHLIAVHDTLDSALAGSRAGANS